ncbi:MAG: hypothetical protein VB080_06510 [Propionicimonas sp.]|uniref:hypothetical protein n=1 Tax=Propionicimonas sp. TaxID=1955623 RepID=UPI002B21E584|nr:hypothetical protein [Propionicimonas sp.]MEA4944076.1 hypothetical protein [Propionicimonas sp.]MEA5054981.1 hypothetical protein [Propionicimonas sp.]MEA5118319.1 hypothetical protein [Propionicimonas sp.]
MAGLLERLRVLLSDPDAAPSDSVEALAVAYQQRLASLHEVRQELGAVAAARRRLAVSGRLADPEAAAWVAARDADLAGREAALRGLSDTLHDQLDACRVERDLISRLPDPDEAARRAGAVLAGWQRDAGELLRTAQDGYPEPSGFVSGEAGPSGFEQPPGVGRGLL